MDYKKQFENIPTETKRKDLLIHPMVNKEKINNATDEEIEEVYYALYSSLDMSMREVIGESMFDDEYF